MHEWLDDYIFTFSLSLTRRHNTLAAAAPAPRAKDEITSPLSRPTYVIYHLYKYYHVSLSNEQEKNGER